MILKMIQEPFHIVQAGGILFEYTISNPTFYEMGFRKDSQKIGVFTNEHLPRTNKKLFRTMLYLRPIKYCREVSLFVGEKRALVPLGLFSLFRTVRPNRET